VILGDSHARSLTGSLEGRKSHNKKDKKKIVILGDSHAKSIAKEVQ